MGLAEFNAAYDAALPLATELTSIEGVTYEKLKSDHLGEMVQLNGLLKQVKIHRDQVDQSGSNADRTEVARKKDALDQTGYFDIIATALTRLANNTEKFRAEADLIGVDITPN